MDVNEHGMLSVYAIKVRTQRFHWYILIVKTMFSKHTRLSFENETVSRLF